jgi:hypothetical protein
MEILRRELSLADSAKSEDGYSSVPLERSA